MNQINKIKCLDSNDGVRLSAIDNLRCIAVVLVLVSHYIGHIFPRFLEFQNSHLNLGTIGVEIFFCISGYVIPYSLVKSDSFNIFWIRRVLRLYPLYFLVAAVAFFALESHPSVEAASNDYASSPFKWTLSFLTMSSYYFQHDTPYGGLEWTLTYEMFFYIACSTVYFIFRRFKNICAKIVLVTVLIALLFLGFIPDLLENDNSLQKATHMYLFFNVGFTLFLYQQNKISKQLFILISSMTVGMILARNVLWMQYWGSNYMTFAWPFAIWIFYSLMLNKIIINQKVISRIGVSSYSIYLIHIFIPATVHINAAPLIQVSIWFVIAVGLSFLSFRWIEAPCVKLAKGLTRRVTVQE